MLSLHPIGSHCVAFVCITPVFRSHNKLHALPGTALCSIAVCGCTVARQCGFPTVHSVACLVLIVLPTLCFCRSSATLELEATTLAATANKLSLSAGWDVRALLKHLQSGIKHLEWAHSFAGSGGVGVASISKQQAYKNNLAHAADLVQQCADLTKKAIAQDKQRKAQGAAGHQGVVNYAFAALRMLADKLYAVAQMNLLFVKTQVRAQKAVQGCSRACAEVCCI